MLPFCRVNFYPKTDNMSEGKTLIKTVGEFSFYKCDDGFMLSDGSSYAAVRKDYETIDMYLPKQGYFVERHVMFLLLNAYRYILLYHGHFQIHSAVVTKHGYGVAFCGVPGAGKSTQAHLWETHVGAEALNLDQPVILLDKDTVLVSGSPWSGKEDCYKPDVVPLKGIVFVEQAKDNTIQSISKAEAYSLLFLNNFMVPFSDEIEEKHKEAVLKMVKNVPCYRLRCTISEEAVKVTYAEIFKDVDKGEYAMKYIAKSDFELKDIAGDIVLLPRGAQTVDYNYVMVFNEAGAEIYKAMSQAVTLDTLAQLLVDKYGIDAEVALNDATEYVQKMLENGIVDCIEA